MTQDFALLKRIYNNFDPFQPLPAGDPAYVDCREVRGDGDILVELGREILLSDRKTCQLYAGHRGAGKSTELRRLQKHLDEEGCFVVYFEADETDIEPEDAQYMDGHHEQIFIDRSEQLQALDCHLVYTVPISLLYSSRAIDVANIYGNAQVLPMIMVQTPENENYKWGIDKVMEVLQKRVSTIDANLSIVDIFEQREALEQLCLMSGGHVRNLLLLMKEAIKYTNTLPITNRALQRSMSKLRNTYRNTIFSNEWEALAKVYASKEIENEPLYRGLLFNRCILEYRYLDEQGGSKTWYDIHPLIKGIKEFQDTYNQLHSTQASKQNIRS